MFVERLTEIEIEKFKNLTPLAIEGKNVPYRVCCNDIFYDDNRGNNTQYIIFLKDFDCYVPFAYERAKNKLKNHYRQFMIDLFGDEYRKALSLYLFKNSSNKTHEEEKSLL